MISLETVLAKAADHLSEPFQSWETIFRSGAGLAMAVIDPSSKTAWHFVLSSFFIGWLIYLSARRRGLINREVSLLGFLCPPAVYRHRSALVDYKYVAVDLSIKAFLYAPFVTGFGWFIYKVVHPPLANLVLVDLSSSTPMVRSIVLTIMAVLMADFAFFLAHYLMHRIPVLWYFHEVHHSAEVLTPVTVYRVHPVEDLLNGCVAGITSAVGAATYATVAGTNIEVVTLFGSNVILLGFFLFAFQLRHSHVWLSYGPLLSRFFISPAQHQIHHSLDPRHWDKNYGFVLAIWDVMFRSLYVPRAREELQFGTRTDPGDFSSVSRLYFLPFVKAAKALMRWRPRPVVAMQKLSPGSDQVRDIRGASRR